MYYYSIPYITVTIICCAMCVYTLFGLAYQDILEWCFWFMLEFALDCPMNIHATHVKGLYSANNQPNRSKDINQSKNENKNTISRNSKLICYLKTPIPACQRNNKVHKTKNAWSQIYPACICVMSSQWPVASPAIQYKACLLLSQPWKRKES